MQAWVHKLQVWNMDQIWEAIKDDRWQAFRISLKGIPTTDKLLKLDTYLMQAAMRNKCTIEELHLKDWKEKCRIDNYINAILRGGQLKRVEGIIKVQR